MRALRAITFGILGAVAMSTVLAALRGLGVPIRLELILGTLTGMEPGPAAFAMGLVIHLAMGAFFGFVYGALFEKVWVHGGAATGVILAVIHAALIGMLVGLTPQFHPLVPERIANPGAYFSNLGVLGVLAFFAVHLLYGAIVGGGYGHVAAEHEWAPTGRL